MKNEFYTLLMVSGCKKTLKGFSNTDNHGIFFYSQWSFHRSLALALFLKVLPALSESMKWESF